jgi:short subunit fatty acids transporter
VLVRVVCATALPEEVVMSLVIVIGAAVVTAALVRKLLDRPAEARIPVRIDSRRRR